MDNPSNSLENKQDGKFLRNALLEFIPYIYKDLWEIGSTPAYKYELLKKHMLTSKIPKILDLGCGKGAELIQLKKKFEFQGVGVDYLPEFIEDAKYRMQINECDGIEFYVDDFKQNINNYKNFDIVLYTHSGDIFGPLNDTLNALKSTIKPNGHILIDSNSRKSNAKHPYSLKFLKFAEIKQTFENCSCELLGYIFWDPKNIKRENEFKKNVLTARINELIEKYPEKAELLQNYLNFSIEKMYLLETEIDTLTWLLKSK